MSEAVLNRYLVMMFRRPDVDPAVIPLHQQFLADLKERGINEMSGPFGDHSGGAYLLRAASLEAAQAIAFADPAHTSGGWDITLYAWNVR